MTRECRDFGYLCFSFADHNWGLEVDVNDHQEFVIAWLEEQVLDVAEEDICGKLECIGGYGGMVLTNLMLGACVIS